jgi:hypothetical protein
VEQNMNHAISIQKSEPFLTKRRLGLAGVAAIAGCTAACSLPFVTAAVGGGAALAALAGFFGGGVELLAGGVAFAGALGVMAVRARRSRHVPEPRQDIPVVCDPTLFSKEERVAHVEQTKDLLLRRPRRMQALEDGIEFHYEGDERLLAELANWAAFEHRCCSWARFSLEIEPFTPGASGALRLRMTGGPEGRTLLLESLKQLENDGPILREFLRGDAKLTAESVSGKARTCGC